MPLTNTPFDKAVTKLEIQGNFLNLKKEHLPSTLGLPW